MHDIKFIREFPEQFDQAMIHRGGAPSSDLILRLDEQHRGIMTELQELQSLRNSIAKKFGEAKSKGQDTDVLSKEADDTKEKIAHKEKAVSQVAEELHLLLSSLPNLLGPNTPIGSSETDNPVIRTVGEVKKFSFAPKPHYELGEDLGLMDFERAAKISGARFVTTYGEIARLERALASFMLDIHTKEFGYTEVYVPNLVLEKALYGTAQLPKFREDQFETTAGLWLIPTAEVALTNLRADEIILDTELPLRMTAYTPCYRAEAGSAGKDTRGLIRMHQFGKVELVSLTHPDDSYEELERMVSAAEEVLKRLKLPYRVISLCSGDIGFGSLQTYDLEVWVPGEDKYREISSCSNCGSFQARRMNTRTKSKLGGDAKKAKTDFVHTLNGSGIAVGRTIVALLENYQQQDGSVVLPEALVPYMGGIEVIKKK